MRWIAGILLVAQATSTAHASTDPIWCGTKEVGIEYDSGYDAGRHFWQIKAIIVGGKNWAKYPDLKSPGGSVIELRQAFQTQLTYYFDIVDRKTGFRLDELRKSKKMDGPYLSFKSTLRLVGEGTWQIDCYLS